jgi:hypothetical protein
MNDYHCRVQVAYDRLFDNRPDAINAVRAAVGANPVDIKKEGINDMALFFKHQLFLAGIKEPIRDKVLEAGKASFQESMKLAREPFTITRKDLTRFWLSRLHCHRRKQPTSFGMNWPTRTSTKFLLSARTGRPALQPVIPLQPPQRSMRPHSGATVPVTPTWSAATARRKGTCSVSATLAAEMVPPLSTPTAKSTRAASTTLLRRMTPWIKLGPNTRMPTLGLLPI